MKRQNEQNVQRNEVLVFEEKNKIVVVQVDKYYKQIVDNIKQIGYLEKVLEQDNQMQMEQKNLDRQGSLDRQEDLDKKEDKDDLDRQDDLDKKEDLEKILNNHCVDIAILQKEQTYLVLMMCLHKVHGDLMKQSSYEHVKIQYSQESVDKHSKSHYEKKQNKTVFSSDKEQKDYHIQVLDKDNYHKEQKMNQNMDDYNYDKDVDQGHMTKKYLHQIPMYLM